MSQLYVNGNVVVTTPAPVEKPITKGNDEAWQQWFPIALKLCNEKNKKLNCEIRDGFKILHKFNVSPKK